MNFKIIMLLQKEINIFLKNNNQLKKNGVKIFHKVPQDSKMPYIVMNIINIKDCSLLHSKSLSFNLELKCFYSSSLNNDIIKTIFVLEKIIQNFKFDQNGFTLSRMNFTEVNRINESGDNNSDIFKLKFFGLLRQYEN